jgi:CRISPR-associated protein Csd1
MEIVKAGKDTFRHLPPWVILSETTVKKKAADAAPLLGGQFMESIVKGSRYPMTLYQAIINRIRAGEETNKTKAAIIKAILIRNYDEREVTSLALNTETDNKAYVLGRLFSVLERLQQQASGGNLNATIRDKYFTSACANPRSVFPTLLKLSMHHSAKLDTAYYEILKTELLGKLDVEQPFPSSLSLDDQGRFILGYYHQTQDFFTPRKEKENMEEDNNV